MLALTTGLRSNLGTLSVHIVMFEKSIRRQHDPILTHSLVSGHCYARSTRFVGYGLCRLGLRRLDGIGHRGGRVRHVARSRSSDLRSVLIVKATPARCAATQ